MRQQTIPPRLVAAMFAISIAACGGSSAAPTAAPATVPSTVATSITSGSWTISSLTQRTEDKSSKFAGYSFVFAGDEGGSVTATKNGSSVSGSWSHTPAVNYYGSTSTESITLNFGTASPFDMVTKTWNVESSSSTKLTLVSPEVAEDSHLVFARP